MQDPRQRDAANMQRRKQKVTVDFNQVRIDFLDNYLEQFYDENVDVKT
jgi:hypothetical protein